MKTSFTNSPGIFLEAQQEQVVKLNKKPSKHQLKMEASIRNVKALNNAVKYRHLLRCLYTNHPVGILTKVKLQKIQFNEKSQLINNREDKSYLDQAVNAHNKLWKIFDKDIQSSSNKPELKLHRSYYY